MYNGKKGLSIVVLFGLLLIISSCTFNNKGTIESIQADLDKSGIELPGKFYFRFYRSLRDTPGYYVSADVYEATLAFSTMFLPYSLFRMEIPVYEPSRSWPLEYLPPVDDPMVDNSKDVIIIMAKHKLSKLVIDKNKVVRYIIRSE